MWTNFDQVATAEAGGKNFLSRLRPKKDRLPNTDIYSISSDLAKFSEYISTGTLLPTVEM